MKKGQYSVEKIISILQEAESGISAKELCRQYGLSENTFYRWKAKYGGMTTQEARRLKDLEHENARLKKLVANQALEIDAMKDVLSKNC